MNTIRQGPRIRLNTPAKINLFLELRGRREDGYHELETLMVPVNVYDSIFARKRTDSQLRFDCCWAPGFHGAYGGELPAVEQNLAYAALELLRRRKGVSAGADVFLLKRIPSQAGLGGASSDAAAALVAGNRIWNLQVGREELAELAAELGSDVPFFLFSGPARCTGRGEIIQPVQSHGRLSLVVVKPPEGLSTASVFKRATVPVVPMSSVPLTSAMQRMQPAEVGGLLFNRLQVAANHLTSWINEIATIVESLGVCGHQMSGSGSCYFALCRNCKHARQVGAKLQARGIGRVFTAATTNGLNPA